MTLSTLRRRRHGLLAVLAAALLLVTGSFALGGAWTSAAPGVQPAAAGASTGTDTIRLRTGTPGTAPETAFFSTRLPKGSYEMSMSGVFIPSAGTDTAYLQCLVVDARLFQQPTDPDFRKVFLVDVMNFNRNEAYDEWDSVVDQTNVVTLDRERKVVYGCETGGAGIEQKKPLAVYVTPLAGVDNRLGAPFTIPAPRTATGSPLRLLR